MNEVIVIVLVIVLVMVLYTPVFNDLNMIQILLIVAVSSVGLHANETGSPNVRAVTGSGEGWRKFNRPGHSGGPTNQPHKWKTGPANLTRPMKPMLVSDIKDHKVSRADVDKLDQTIRDVILGRVKYDVSHVEPRLGNAVGFSRILDPDAPAMPYQSRKSSLKRTVHWGQLKLMLSEIEFLTIIVKHHKQTGDKRPIHVVYAGAAPGHHIPKLSQMFPTVHFDLYDPNKFVVQNTDRIKVNQQFFTDIEADYWSKESTTGNSYTALISDIRTEPATPENVDIDMKRQSGWWSMMNPDLTMFKFRLPWESTAMYKYPAGDIYLQAYPGPTSTETRLVIKKDAKIIDYDCSKYENQCFYHNTIVRMKSHTFGDRKYDLLTDGIDNCYDCASFYHIVKEYLSINDPDPTPEKIVEYVREVQRTITGGRHTVYSQTVEEMEKRFNVWRGTVFEKCDRPRCSVCKQEAPNILVAKKGKVSRAQDTTHAMLDEIAKTVRENRS